MILKNIKYILLLAIITSACDDFLDRAPNISLNEEAVFSNFDNAEKYHNDTYSHLVNGYTEIWNGYHSMPLACVSDEGDSFQGYNTGVNSFNTGGYNNQDNKLDNSYQGIRKANKFLSKVDLIPFPDEATKNGMMGEAYFLRAFYFNDIVKRYGGLQILTEDNILMPGDDLMFARNTYQESVDQMLSDLDLAISMLPATRSDADLGRATKGAAIALKSRILLYAASPLWQSHYKDPAGGNVWQLAADAAKAVIDLQDGGVLVYELFDKTEDGKTGVDAWERLFFTRRVNNEGNKEVIFHKHISPIGFSNAAIKNWAPIGDGIEGFGEVNPLENFVELYEMSDGRPGTDADPNDPYANREPRFYKSILYNGAMWQGVEIETFVGGTHNKESGKYPQTGYYVRKMLPEEVQATTPSKSNHDWIFFRLAEMYLNYAEAINEVSGPTQEVYDAVNKIRLRVGHVPLPAGLSKDDMRIAIHHERAIELAFEGHRWFDARRWLKAREWFGGTMYKMKITKDNGSLKYEKVFHETRIYRDVMNLYPIPLGEMKKNSFLVQNPGW